MGLTVDREKEAAEINATDETNEPVEDKNVTTSSEHLSDTSLEQTSPIDVVDNTESK